MVRKLRSLLKKTGREEHSSLLLEGSHLLEEALKTNFLPTEVIATPEWCDQHEEILKKIPSREFYSGLPEIIKYGLIKKNSILKNLKNTGIY